MYLPLPNIRNLAKKIGTKFYFTGKPCPRDHVNLRRTTTGACITCERAKSRNYQRANKERLMSCPERVERIKKYKSDWAIKNRERKNELNSEWKRNNPKKMREMESKWRAKPKSKAIVFMRDSLRRSLVRKNSRRTEALLGYTRCELVSHIERQFLKGMSWDNHGEWHIDHIIPISHFVDKGENDPAVVNCLSNLRPIWARDNYSKNNAMEVLL